MEREEFSEGIEKLIYFAKADSSVPIESGFGSCLVEMPSLDDRRFSKG